MNRIALLLLFMAFFGAACNNKPNQMPTKISDKKTASIGGKQLNIEIADNVFEREKGLGGRDSLPENDGMLFVFEKEGRHGFWMLDTNFPLDFIWIKDNSVTEITANVPTQPGVEEKDLTVYNPSMPVDSMLEVNAGWTAKNNIKVGDSVDLTSQ